MKEKDTEKKKWYCDFKLYLNNEKNKFCLGIININDDSEEVDLLQHNQHNQQQQSETEFSFDNEEANFDEFITQQFNLITEELSVEDLPQLVQPPPSSQNTLRVLSPALSPKSITRDRPQSQLVATTNPVGVDIISTEPPKPSYTEHCNYNYTKRSNPNPGRGMSGGHSQLQSQSFDEISSEYNSDILILIQYYKKITTLVLFAVNLPVGQSNW